MIFKVNRIFSYPAFILLLMAGGKIVAADSDVTKSISSDIGKTTVEHQMLEDKAEGLVKAANTAYFKGQYKNAIDLYLQGIDLLKKCSQVKTKYFEAKIANCKEQIYRCYYYWAMNVAADAEKLSQASQFDEAIEMCQKAIEIYPPCKKRMETRIASFEKRKKSAEFRSAATVEKLLPDKENQEYNIQIMLKQGDDYLKAKRYSEARKKYEQVLLIDPYQLDAIERLRVANLKIQKSADARAMGTIKERVAEVAWKNVVPITPETVTGEENSLSGPVTKISTNDAIVEKLQNIIIPKIVFDDVSLPAAVDHLRKISKQLDPEGNGVNIFLILTPPKVQDMATENKTAADPLGGVVPGGDPAMMAGGVPGPDMAAVPAAAAPAAAPSADASADADTEEIPNVNLRLLSSKPLGQVIHYVCKSAGVKYRIERYAVVIARKSIPLDELETRIYPIEQSALSSVGDDLKQHFIDSGIDFPSGSKIIYDKRISRLIVTNTPDNLRNIETLIHDELNTPEPQVLIQAKFIEIEQNDLQEMAFTYYLNRDLGAESGTTSGKLEFDTNDNVLRHVGGDQIFAYVTSTNGYNFAFSVNALDQADSSDLLASPRVVTMDGEEATIRMIREVYFPSDWSEATTSSSTSDAGGTSFTYISSTPEFDDPTELGIVLKVTPKVDLEKGTVTLQMNPTIQSQLGWTDYSYDITEDGVPRREILREPIIAERTVDTKVTVYDGETVVLGGIIRDNVQEVHDKIPILGDIPVVGRAFQSRYTQSKKVNLLIFLTCRLVRPDGTLFNPTTKPRGVPFFKRLK